MVTADRLVSPMAGGLDANTEKDDAGQCDDGSFQTYPGVGTDKVLSYRLGWLPGKGCQWNRCDGCVHIQLKHSPVYSQNHDK